MTKIEQSQKSSIDIFSYIPLIILGGLVPLILYSKPIMLDPLTSKLIGYSGVKVDIYSYYKMMTTFVTGIVMLVMLLVYKGIEIKDTIKTREIETKSALVFGLLMFSAISTIMSQYKSVAITGFDDRYEGFLAFFTYFVAVIYSYYFIDRHDKVNKVVKFIGISSLIVSIFGLLEYFGYPLLSQQWFIKLITSSSLFNEIKSLNYTLGKFRISSTLYNPNFVGSYMAIVITMMIGYFIDNKDKKITKFIYILMPVLGFTLAGSKSSAGVVGIIVSFAIMIISVLLAKGGKKAIAQVLILIVLASASFFAEPLVSGSDELISSEINDLSNNSVLSDHVYKNIDVEPTYIKIDYDDLAFMMSIDGDRLEFKDSNGQVLKYQLDTTTNVMKIDDDRYRDVLLKFTKDNTSAILKIGKLDLAIGFTKDGLAYSDPYSNVYKQEPTIPSIGFEGKERFGNSRGYLWSRSLPLIKETIIIGKGPDTFAFYFPQNDILGKINYLSDYRMLVDKPHNMYIQMAVDNGLISVLLFIVLMFMIGLKLLLDLLKKQDVSFIRIGIVSGIIGYCVAAVFNDSNICVSPLFWTAVGLSVALERIENSKLKAPF